MKKLLVVTMCVTLMLSLFACSSTPTGTSATTAAGTSTTAAASSTSASNATTGSKLKIGVSINATSNVHNQSVYETTIANGKKRGHEIIATNANGAAAQQADDIENLIEQNCNVIIVQNGEAESLKNVVAAARKRGIFIISYESGWIEGCNAMFAVNDWEAASKLYMKIAAQMGFEGEIITLHHNDHPVPRSHYLVIQAMLKEYKNIIEVNAGYTGYPGSTELAYNIVQSALIANPKVKAIWATFDLEAIGALQACKAAGREDIAIIGYDGEQDILKNISEGGQVIATANTSFEKACDEVITVCEKLVAGEKVNAFHGIDCNIIDASNISEFYKP